ncbi:structure-specific recognition protein [Sarcoptes scabiei]|nr:structure-specific recognition protein [Sarcoptes scabiei]
MTEIVGQSDLINSSPDQSPQHPWPMVPVLQTLTVLSDGEEEQMEQKMGIENGSTSFGIGGAISLTKLDLTSSPTTPQDLSSNQIDTIIATSLNNHHFHDKQQNFSSQYSHQSNSNGNSNQQKRKVGRPITSAKTMNRSFPAVDEIRAKLEAGECYVRPRASSSSSDVWALFQEVAYKDNHFFTGIVQCKNCHFLTRYHGQITGTSHMRRHHCFSLMFPNSTPANRKPKIANSTSTTSPTPITTTTTTSSSSSSIKINRNTLSPSTATSLINTSVNGNHNQTITSTNNNTTNETINGQSTFNGNMDADSTTPRMLKRIKKELNNLNYHQQPFHNSSGLLQQNHNHLVIGDTTASSLINNPNITIHPAIPKKKFKHRNPIVPNSGGGDRSLISPILSNGNLNSGVNGSLSILRTSNGFGGSSTSLSSPHHQSSSSSSSSSTASSSSSLSNSHISNNNVPTNHSRATQTSKQELRERLIQFCAEELIPLKSVGSDSFRLILQSHLKLCVSQISQQFHQQSQLMNFASTFSSCVQHMPTQIPDADQLRAYLDLLHRHCCDKIRSDVNTNLENNVGSALVCDSDHDACIISVYYVDADWQLTEAILSASSMVLDINKFVTETLENYCLQDRKKLSKFTFVSHGGQFGGVSVCLSSMAHIVDKVVEESLQNLEDWLLNSEHLPHLNDFFDNCHETAIKLNVKIEPNSYDADWIMKFDTMKALVEHSKSESKDPSSSSTSLLLATLDLGLISSILKLLEPFRTASHELRQCYDHPTLCHVLLYFHKLKKFLSNHQPVYHKPNGQPMGLVRSKTTNSSNKSSEMKNIHSKRKPQKMNEKTSNRYGRPDNSDSESDDSTEEKSIGIDKSSQNYEDTKTDEIDPNQNKYEKNEQSSDDEECEDGQDEDDDQDEDKENNYTNVLIQLKELLLENLVKLYQVQSLHKMATFLWPNFRLLKMLSVDEQKEVHEDVRKFLQTRIQSNGTSAKRRNKRNDNEDNNDDEDIDDEHCEYRGKNNNGKLSETNDFDDGSNRNAKMKNGSDGGKRFRSNFDEWEIFSDDDQDEVDKYLSVQLTSCSENYVLQWWKEHSNEFPNLAQLAKWLLSIPASVTTRERFQISKTSKVEDKLFFLHGNMHTNRFDLAQISKKLSSSLGSIKSNRSKMIPNSNNSGNYNSNSNGGNFILNQSQQQKSMLNNHNQFHHQNLINANNLPFNLITNSNHHH